MTDNTTPETPDQDDAGIRLPAGFAVLASALPLQHEPVVPLNVLEGAPTTGGHDLGTVGGVAFGVWEMTPGVSSDVETDEVFVVLSGRGVVEIEPTDSTAKSTRVHLEPGTVCRLSDGMRTVWTVTETLRKMYLLGAH